MKFLKSLFTEHLLAKFFALVFAMVTVYLVDRELRTVWYDQSFVLLDEQPSKKELQEPYIVIQADPGIWFDQRELSSVRLKIRGREGDLETFKDDPKIVLRIRQSWAAEKEWEVKTRILTDDDFSIPGQEDVEITVEPNLPIDVDRLVTISDLPLELDVPKALWPTGVVYEPRNNKIEPKRATLRGPRNLLARYRDDKDATIRLSLGERLAPVSSDPTVAYPVGLKKSDRLAGLEIVEPAQIQARVGIRPEDESEFLLGSFDVNLILPYSIYETLDEGDTKFSIETVANRKVELYLRGRDSVVERYRSGAMRQELMSRLRVMIDPRKAVLEVSAGSPAPPNLDAKLVILEGALPEGLKLDRIEPRLIPVTIKKN